LHRLQIDDYQVYLNARSYLGAYGQGDLEKIRAFLKELPPNTRQTLDEVDTWFSKNGDTDYEVIRIICAERLE
jgi:hypothetical protein